MTYKLPQKARELVLYQRTSLLPARKKPNAFVRVLQKLNLLDDGYKEFVREYATAKPTLIDQDYFQSMGTLAEELLPHIPADTTSILDIGCGIAGLDLFLYKRLKSPKLFLLDKTAVEEKIWYMFKQQGAFYNSLELARENLQTNGVSADAIKCLEAPDDGCIDLPGKSIDLVVSTISWGFHYPVSTYLASVERILKEDGVLLIDVRKGPGGEADLATSFQVETVFEGAKHQTIRATRKHKP
ncbi:MAG: hypothetical protein ACFHXK_18730 [bacterium]